MKKKIINLIKWIVISVLIICFTFLIVVFIKNGTLKDIIIKKKLEIKSINNISYKDGDVYACIETYNLIINRDLWCISTENENTPEFNEDWQKIVDNKCYIKIDNDDKYIYIRDNKNNMEKNTISDYISSIAKIEVKENIKLIKDESKKIDLILRTVGNPDKTINYETEDENIAKIENDKIIGVNDGKTKITVSDNYGNSETIGVEVTSLISLPKINNWRPFISYKQYTEEEAKILDDYLFYQVDEAGYKTRAGVVAAARFLTLEFQYRVPYFLENGRLGNLKYGRPYADGEGRYYHRGLYLSTDKYDDIEKSSAGPSMWGGYITEYSTDNGKMRNGLDCSGFVCWCLVNGGFDFGDIGAGLNEGLPVLSDLGDRQWITMDLLESGKVKAGDLIGRDGHIGIIIGIDEKHVYVADSLHYSKGNWVTEYTYRELVNSAWAHIYDFTDEYGKEGNYTNMW